MMRKCEINQYLFNGLVDSVVNEEALPRMVALERRLELVDLVGLQRRRRRRRRRRMRSMLRLSIRLSIQTAAAAAALRRRRCAGRGVE